MPPTTADQPAQALADQLGGVSTRPRADLAVSRHIFQNKPCFVVRDPVTFAAHRFEPEQYETLIAIGNHDTLREAFTALVAEGTLELSEEEDFYAFVLDLHRSGLLTLPVSDHKTLYKRHDARRRKERKAKILSPIFVKIPLCNPDAFFDRVTPFVRWMFTRGALAGWAMLMLAAATVAWLNKDNLEAPLLAALEFETLPLLWLLLILLKAVHELGHGFACKVFGGKVPEIGAFLIAGTPAAYVDASASWGFHDVRHRVIVILSGMYFESICAAIALFVWASTPPGMVNTAAFQTVIMASVVTIGFNINPLAKFDGYYLLSDLTGIPNLRQRASAELAAWFDRIGLGLPAAPSDFDARTRVLLAAYGVGAAIYRVVLLLTISIMIASKAFVIGVALALLYVGTTVTGALTSWGRYLWFAPKTQPVRRRAVALSIGGTALAAIAIAMVPVPGRTTVPGVVGLDSERTLRAPAPGIVAAIPPKPGDRVGPGDVIMTLIDTEADLAIREAETSIQLASLELHAGEAEGDAAAVASAQARLEQTRREYDAVSQRAASRDITATDRETVLSINPAVIRGAFIRRGDPLVTIGGGAATATLYLEGADAADAQLVEGAPLRVFAASDPGSLVDGTITRVSASASPETIAAPLAHTNGGTVMVDPDTRRPVTPLVEVTVRFDDPPETFTSGTRVWAVIDTADRTLLAAAWRGLRTLTDGLATQ